MGVGLQDLDESELVEWLFSSPTLIFTAFEFMFTRAIGFQAAEWELEFWLGLDRTAVGLPPGQRPGDIDILIIPKLDGDRFAERAMAVEAKKFFASRVKRDRSPNSFGSEQVRGLFADGFPFVGLLHLGMVEASHASQFVRYPLLIGVNKAGEYVYGDEVLIDPACSGVADRHDGRLRRIDIPYFSGYKAYVFQLSEAGDRFVGTNANDSRAPIKNPNVCKELVGSLRRLELEPDCVVRFSYGRVDIRRRPTFRDEDNLLPLID